MPKKTQPDNWHRSWKLSAPATQKQIDALEKAIGRSLPPDYREFLRRANGGKGYAGDNPAVLFPAKRVLPETRDMEVDEQEPGLYLIGDWNAEFLALDLRDKKPLYVTYAPVSGGTTARGATLAEMFKRLATGDAAPEPRKAAPRSPLRGTGLQEVRQFGETKDQRLTALASRGNVVVAGSRDRGPLRVWDFKTGKKLSLLSQDKGVLGANLSRDARRAVTVYWSDRSDLSDSVIAWDLAAGAAIGKFESLGDKIMGADFVGTSQLVLFVTFYGRMCLWDPSANKLIREVKLDSELRCMAVSPDGKQFAAAGSEGNIELYACDSLALLARLRADDGLCSSFSMEFSPDGTLLLDVRNYTSSVTNVPDRTLVSNVGGVGGGCAGAFLADGAFYAAPIDDAKSLALVESHTGKIVWQTRGRNEQFYRMAATEDGQHLLTSGDSTGLVRVWKLSQAK